jgi:hypothetical protein
MDFDAYLQSKGYAPGTRIPAAAARQLHAQFLKDSSGSEFQPKTGTATNQTTGDVVRYFTSSSNSAQVLPEERFKEGPIDKDGTQLVFDPSKGDYFPATNRATKSPVKPKAKTSGFAIGPNGQIMPAGMMEPEATPAPTPEAAMTNSMAFQGVPSREATMPTMPAKTLSSGVMGGDQGISMTPVAQAAAAATNAPAPVLSSPEEIRAAYQRNQISRDEAIRLLRGGS